MSDPKQPSASDARPEPAQPPAKTYAEIEAHAKTYAALPKIKRPALSSNLADWPTGKQRG